MTGWTMTTILLLLSCILGIPVGDTTTKISSSIDSKPRRRSQTAILSSFVNRPIPIHGRGMVPKNIQELYIEQPMDHFSPSSPLAKEEEESKEAAANTTYSQRYFLYDEYYEPGGPMFFYLGNEADVTLYVNATGLMWENAPEFRALVVFAEHRYYGKSLLFENITTTATTTATDEEKEEKKANVDVSKLKYLSSEQAIMDYVELIQYLKELYAFDFEADAVIGFGGSYGGMLASWARYKYPHVWDGAIAASAPIIDFEGIEELVPDFYTQGVTYDVSIKGGDSNGYCEKNLRKAFANRTLTQIDPQLLRRIFRLCDDDDDDDDSVVVSDIDDDSSNLGMEITGWISEALSYMSMGNFPYPSSYILNGDGVLPAFPVRVACRYLAEKDMTGDDDIHDWLEGLASFASVYYNYTHTLSCNTVTKSVNKESELVNQLWNYQYCSEIFMVLGQTNSARDMYWDDPWDGDAAAKNCYDQYGLHTDRYHFYLNYGNPLRDWARSTSNIVWSQGEYDPWRGGGVTTNVSDSLVSMTIPEAAHHLDLFFSHENDTKYVKEARRLEVRHMQTWVDEKKQKSKKKKKNLRVAETMNES